MNAKETPDPWVLVAGDFNRKGGMDRANLALAEYLLELNTPIHLVTHRVEPGFEKHPLARVHLVPRPAGSHLLGAYLLSSHAQRIARGVLRQWPRAQVVVNGGNCIWPGINWAH